MKTMIKLYAAMLILFCSGFAYSYNLKIYNPNECPGRITPQFYPNTVIQVSFKFDRVDLLDQELGRCRISVFQNNNSLTMYDNILQSNVTHSIPINTTDLPGFCFNEAAEIHIYVNPIDHPVPDFASAQFINYKAGQGCNNMCLRNGTACQTYSHVLGQLTRSTLCDLPGSIYVIDQYKVSFTVNEDFRNCVVQTIPELSFGWSGALPNNQNRWASLISFNDHQATFVTFCYRIWSILGTDLGWFPADPDHLTVAYRKICTPVVNRLWQYPYPGSSLNPVVNIFADVSPPNTPFYNWRDTLRPSNFSFQIMNNYVQVTRQFGAFLNPAENYRVKLQTGNAFQWSNWSDLRIEYCNDIPACLFLRCKLDSINVEENPVLINTVNRAEFLPDFIEMQNPILRKSSLINFDLHEIGNGGFAHVDQVELFKVTADPKNEIAVTPGGKIINYFAGEENGKVTAIYNDVDDVTDILKFADNNSIELQQGDEIKINFVRDDNLFMVLSPFLPVNKEIIGGYITDDNGLIDSFYVRPNYSNVCIELKNSVAGSLKLSAKQNFKLERILVVSNIESRKVEKLQPKSVILNGKDVQNELSNADNKALLISNGDLLSFSFKNTPDSSKNSFFVLKNVGKYSKNKSQRLTTGRSFIDRITNFPNPFNPETKIKFELQRNANVSVKVFDLTGRLIQTLLNEYIGSGLHEIIFNGSELASGVYFYQIETDNFKSTGRMTLIK